MGQEGKGASGKREARGSGVRSQESGVRARSGAAGRGESQWFFSAVSWILAPGARFDPDFDSDFDFDGSGAHSAGL